MRILFLPMATRTSKPMSKASYSATLLVVLPRAAQLLDDAARLILDYGAATRIAGIAPGSAIDH
jgi:hypothetical protein